MGIKPKILVVDDENDLCTLIKENLEEVAQFEVVTTSDPLIVEDLCEKEMPDLLLIDVVMPSRSGSEVIASLKKDPRTSSLPIVVMSGLGEMVYFKKKDKWRWLPNSEVVRNRGEILEEKDSRKAAEAYGVDDYIEKPFKQDRLLHVLKRAIETARLKAENSELKMRVGSSRMFIGNATCMVQLRQSIEKVAPTGSRVFVAGPAGSGKEVIARNIHEKSHRKKGPFVVLSVSSISPDVIDQELFGTEESNDINAPPRKVGIFEQANGGTLFIDEVTDIPVSVQGKLVRFLQDKTLQRVGGTRKIESDVRVIAATNKDIQEEIKLGRMREDLYYRLNVVPLRAPALRERREDIPMLCDYFLAQASEAAKIPPRKLSDDAIAAMQSYDWPGNVRQLRNVIEWLLIMCPGGSNDSISSDLLPREIFSSTPASITPEVNPDIMSMKLREAREVFERQYLAAQINRFGGNISRTASFIGMERSALHRKLKSLEVVNAEEKISA